MKNKIVSTEYYFNAGFENRNDDGNELRGNLDGSLEQALSRAERLIDLVSMGKVREIEKLNEAAQERLKYAICVQAEWFLTYGYGSNDAIDCKVKIGDFSYESRNNGVIHNLAPEAQGVLRLAGLLYTGMGAK
ncbi:MAG: hypothetical protein FWE74_10735 [Oscillospiraceae bacterium]|nr:hypothetical protein [Oscillospiraceae bacterium]